MRHDPASGAIVIMLRSLKMYGMAQVVTDLIAQRTPAFEAAVLILSQLLKAELAERELRSIAYHMKSARFPAYKDLRIRPRRRRDQRGHYQDTAPLRVHGWRAEHRVVRRPEQRKNPCRDRLPRSSHRTSSPQSPLLLHHRTGQRPRTGKGQGQGRADCRKPHEAGLRDPQRVGLPAVQRLGRGAYVPSVPAAVLRGPMAHQ